MSSTLVVLRRDQDLGEVEMAVRECPLCGALVAESSVREHEAFHVTLRRVAAAASY